MNPSDFQSMMSSFMQNINKDRTVSAKAGGDWVVAHVNLKMQLIKVELSEEARAQNPAVLSELIVSAVNQANSEARKALQQEMMEWGKKMGLPTHLFMPFMEKMMEK